MEKRVLVLGGGVAGMSTAHELIERGFAVEVHEAKRVPGGKARTIEVPNSASPGRPNLPGEHGFRFFPSFYKHLPDTMKRIPARGRSGSVYDRLVQAREYLIADGPRRDLTFLVRFPRSLGEWGELLRSLVHGMELDIPPHELMFFVSRLLVILTSCQQRRLAEYEQIDWWRFIAADDKSEAYRKFLAVGLTRSLVALQAQEASTRTIGDILIQLLLGIYSPFTEFDRVLDGPTSEIWLEPWLHHLQALGVRYRRGSRVVAIDCGADGQIAGVTVEDEAGARNVVRSDYYVLAMPVEALVPLIGERLVAAEPRLGRLDQLRVAWMNGLQLFLRRDEPLVAGHSNFVSTPNALTAIAQAQFFSRPLGEYGRGEAHGCLSIDISNWDAPGIVFGRPLRDLSSAAEVMTEVRAQLQAALKPELARALDDSNLAAWFLDSDIQFPNPSPAVNLEPLLINTIGSWGNRPDAQTSIPNLFLAADYVRTYTDLATMEGANEAARRAVNGILAASGSTARPCRLWSLREPFLFAPARGLDWIRFKLGLPHIGLSRPELDKLRTQPPTKRRSLAVDELAEVPATPRSAAGSG
jgi:uncharacterized protein with NAD-binding domain and iron-sulfur cluster